MPNRTLQEIMADSAGAAGAINGYHAKLDALKAKGRPDMGGFEGELSPAEAERIRRQRALKTARAARDEALEAYNKSGLAANHERINAWKCEAASELFYVEDANALATGAGADEAALRGMIEMAAMSGNEEVGRAAFVAATHRGLGDVQAEYFNSVAPDARELYEEYRQAPDDETLRRQIENADRLVPEPTEADVTGHPVYAGGVASYGDL